MDMEKGKQIIKIERVVELANLGRSIYYGITKRIIPAAFMQNYQARHLWHMVNSGQLYEYKPKKK